MTPRTIRSIDDLTPDARNANRGFDRPTGRSAEMIAELERLVQEALRGRRKRA